MAENSNIEWTHHTYNPWRGCTKVSAGCKNCYAEGLSKRNPAVLGIWGDAGTRPVAAESYWKLPLAWDKAAAAAGERHRVFCASLADVFEDRADLHAPRLRLFDLIRQTPNLDWLLLTKRPENIEPALGVAYLDATGDLLLWLDAWILGNPPANVWLGTSVEHQEAANNRIPHLLAAPAVMRFLSCEPLLGPVKLDGHEYPIASGLRGNLDWLTGHDSQISSIYGGSYAWHNRDIYGGEDRVPGKAIDWVIVGGESGPGARPMHPEWSRSLRDQCQAAGVPFLFKQWGEWAPHEVVQANCRPSTIVARLGYKLHDFTPDLVAKFPGDNPHIISWKVGKHQAGRLLDGQLHDGFPARP